MNIKVNVRWYQWLSGLISLALAVFLIHDGLATYAEQEPQVLGTLFLLVGIPLLVFLYITFGLRWSLKQVRRDKSIS